MPLFCLAVERVRAATSCNSSLVACMVSIVQRVLLSPHTMLYLQCIICKQQSISLEQACVLRSYFHPMFQPMKSHPTLTDKHPNQLQQWNIKNIFIDEYHNIFGELFRHTNSWTSLRNLARHNIKITLLSATANILLMDFVGHYLGLGNYKVIGELDQYPIPDVVIDMSNVIVMVNCYLKS